MNLRHFNNLAYEEIGEENSETILFLHTKLLDKWIWKRQKEDYDKQFKGFHCIFLDLPNHGESISEEEFSIEKSSIEISEFINYIIINKDIEKVNIVALGIGGSIAIEILNENPQMIGNLILSGLEIADYKESESDSIANGLAKAQSEYLNEKSDIFITKAYLRYFGIKKEHYNDVERILERSVSEERKIAFESLNYTIPGSLKDNEDIIEKENVLIIYGTKEDLNCTKSAIDLKNTLTNAKLVEIVRGNHLWNIIDNELFNTIISNFIKDNHIEENSKINIIE
ncbi:alpha/beta fold hydrolase [Methanobrevibacter ruminantium]|uniref:alpha/beta fold hydrolase n=1 Tax=Methanobrevibacter ruminantium TaxID=83816 RepID=UPI003F01C7FE